jgi:hypothetical protein
MPSALFGVNAAWWAIMIIAMNLNTTMKRKRRLQAVLRTVQLAHDDR